MGIVICNEDTSCCEECLLFSAVISSNCSIAASTNRYKHLNLSLSFSGGVGGGVCMLHTLACCCIVVSCEEVLINIGLVLDISNGTSEEEYDEEEED